MIGSRTTDGDTVLGRAFDAMQAIALDVATGATAVEARFRTIGAGHAVLCAPVQLDGQNLGAIELVDPVEPGGFTDGDRHAMTYVGERFAEFLSDRSIVL
jgi:GAF domain-containing protein